MLRWTKSTAYADYYERALTNGVLSIQRGTEAGVIIYFLSMQIGGSKANDYWRWSGPFNSFWSSIGTGIFFIFFWYFRVTRNLTLIILVNTLQFFTAIESFAKLGDSIYFEEQDEATLYVFQYVSSTINWKKGNLQLEQVVMPLTSWDTNLQVSLNINIYPNKV